MRNTFFGLKNLRMCIVARALGVGAGALFPAVESRSLTAAVRLRLCPQGSCRQKKKEIFCIFSKSNDDFVFLDSVQQLICLGLETAKLSMNELKLTKQNKQSK